ncbi:bifunctional endo-1,4-beta-xylanase XylA-like [Armigeres subalbatus]|uniref:bifunctional endo-1,4-beta-xylanase XylA-like n=1 Tax=Armigeres subalbatus TaxID=124917 RepID=UPI002ED5CB9A
MIAVILYIYVLFIGDTLGQNNDPSKGISPSAQPQGFYSQNNDNNGLSNQVSNSNGFTEWNNLQAYNQRNYIPNSNQWQPMTNFNYYNPFNPRQWNGDPYSSRALPGSNNSPYLPIPQGYYSKDRSDDNGYGYDNPRANYGSANADALNYLYYMYNRFGYDPRWATAFGNTGNRRQDMFGMPWPYRGNVKPKTTKKPATTTTTTLQPYRKSKFIVPNMWG